MSLNAQFTVIAFHVTGVVSLGYAKARPDRWGSELCIYNSGTLPISVLVNFAVVIMLCDAESPGELSHVIKAKHLLLVSF